ncbi:MAG: hypothetical protein EB127_31485 [Alphaproteobacteria bacterium]|nr:hypothetical protein [Alphaproteobacteria bacterium]
MNITNYNGSLPLIAHDPRYAPKKGQLYVPTLEGKRFDQIRKDPKEESTLAVTMVANRAVSAQCNLSQQQSSKTSKRKVISSADNPSILLKQKKAKETPIIIEENRSTTISPHCVAEYKRACADIQDGSVTPERDTVRKQGIDKETIQTLSGGNDHRRLTPDTLTVKNQEGKKVLIDCSTRWQQLPRQENVARVTNAWERDPDYSDAHIARMLMTMHKWDKWAPESEKT